MRGSQSDRENRIHVSTDLGGLLRFDRSLSTCCSGGGAREHKGGLLVTAIYVRYHFENVKENSLAQAGFARTNPTVSVSYPC
jgi:hypothetical protein